MKKVSIVLFCIFLATFLQAQTAINDTVSLIDKFLQIDKPPLESNLQIPIITLGTGIFSFHGDVKNSNKPNFTVGTPGIHIELSQIISPRTTFGLRFMKGSVTGNSYIPETPISYNFKSQITSFGSQLSFKLGNNSELINYKKNIITPYASIGFEILQRAEAWGDLFSDSTKLFQWSDGTYRNIAESKYNASKSQILFRDYDFETSLQAQNSDNIPYYTPITFSIPLELGATFNINHRVKLNMGYQYHITMSNTIDDISDKGKNYESAPERKGNALPDGYSYAYMSVSFNIASKKNKIIYKSDSIASNNFLSFWDADDDGIDESEDDCPYTPKGVSVFGNGCPLDDDRDGVPNYKDIEKNTRAFVVSQEGKGVTEAEILARMNQKRIVDQNEIYRFYPALLNGGTVFKQFYKKIPWKYKVLDLDKNEYIDIDEMLNAIDTFFDEGPNAGAGSTLSVKDLSELIEFFFLQ